MLLTGCATQEKQTKPIQLTWLTAGSINGKHAVNAYKHTGTHICTPTHIYLLGNIMQSSMWWWIQHTAYFCENCTKIATIVALGEKQILTKSKTIEMGNLLYVVNAILNSFINNLGLITAYRWIWAIAVENYITKSWKLSCCRPKNYFN